MTRPVLRGVPVGYPIRLCGDYFLDNILMCLTFIVGWIFWFGLAANVGQTPAKQILNVRILDYRTGKVASTPQVWFREALLKRLIPLAIGVIVASQTSRDVGVAAIPVTLFIGGSLLFFTRDRRALWDLLAGTVVRRQSQDEPVDWGLAPQKQNELDFLLRRGFIRPDEYERRRRLLEPGFVLTEELSSSSHGGAWDEVTERRKRQELEFLLAHGMIQAEEYERRTRILNGEEVDPRQGVQAPRDPYAPISDAAKLQAKLRELEFMRRRRLISEEEYVRRRDGYSGTASPTSMS